MNTINAGELVQQMPFILARVARGEEFLVIESGQPVARFMAVAQRMAGPGEHSPSPERIARADAALFRHCLPGTAAGGIDNDAIDRELVREYSGARD